MAAPAIAQSPTSGRFTNPTTKFVSTIRPRTASEAAVSDHSLLPLPSDTSTMKGKSVWANDRDPFAATAHPYRTASVRSSSPVQVNRRPMTAGNTPVSSSMGLASGSSTPTAKKQRMSLLLTASDALFSLGGRRGSILRKTSAKPVIEIDQTPVVDIRAIPVAPTDEEAERETLRNEAAKSVGLGTSFIVDRLPLPEEPEGDDDNTTPEDPPDPSQLIRRPSLPMSVVLSPSIDHATFSPNLTSLRSADSSAISLSAETTVQPSRPLPRHIPAFPATVAALTPFTQISSTLLRHYSGGSFFLGKARQWKSRHLVLTSLRPPPPISDPDAEMDTQAHLHLFRSSAGDEKELERMKIDEDSVVFVVDEGPEVSGRKFVLKIGGLHAGGSGPVKDQRKKAPATMASISVVGHPAMAVSFAGGLQDSKVLWLLQCPDTETLQRWISSVKAALLVQRAERAGLGMSLQATNDVRLTGDLDVLLSLRAQGLLQSSSPRQPSSIYIPPSIIGPGPGSASATLQSPSTLSPLSTVVDELSPTLARSARSRSSTTTATSPSSAVNALKGLFSASVMSNGNNRPRSYSSSISGPPVSPVSPVAVAPSVPGIPAMDAHEDPKDSSFGNRASALLNLSLQRATTDSSVPSSSSLLLNQSISATITPHEEIQELDFDSKQRERERLHVGYGSYERPTSSSSLPPPPRAKRSNGGPLFPPRSPVMEQSLQEELQKAIFASSRDASIRRSSNETIPEEGLTPINGKEPSIRNSLDGRGRASYESTDGVITAAERMVPFPVPNGRTGTPQGRTSPPFEGDLTPLQAARPPSALSSVSTNSLQATGNAPTPEPSQAPPIVAGALLARSSSSPKRSRRVPKMLAPPSGPPPSAPMSAPILTPKGEFKSLHPEDAPSGRDRGSTGTSFFNPKRISTSSTGLSIRSFTSGSSSSRSNGVLARASSGANSVRSSAPRPPPSFAPPPTPSSANGSDHPLAISSDFHYNHPFSAEYSPSIRSGHRNSMLSNSSSSPVRSDFNIRLHRLTPPAGPPPSTALPPRPDSVDVSSHRTSNGHNRSNSLNGNALSTIPASPLGRIDDLPIVNGSGSKRLDSSPPAVHPLPSVSRHSSLKARLRMMSTPSSRPPSQVLPPVPAPPSPAPVDPPPSTPEPSGHARTRSNTIDLVIPDPLERPIVPVEERPPLMLAQPPIPPRSQARPQSPRVTPPSDSCQRTLSPPPRRGSRQSREIAVSPIPKTILEPENSANLDSVTEIGA